MFKAGIHFGIINMGLMLQEQRPGIFNFVLSKILWVFIKIKDFIVFILIG